MNLLSEIFCGEEKIFSRKVIFFHAALILASVAFVYMFSHSTSPRYFFIGMDSAIFQVVGKYWAQGYLPYVELFENKGPLLFLINAIGWMIAPRVGLMVPQIIFMYFSLLMLWRAIELCISGVGKKFFFVLTIFYYASHYWEGNNCGEYTMPFLALSTFCFLKTLKISAGEKICPISYGFIYGLGFGACVLLRAANAMPICCYVFLTMIFLIQAHEFKTLLKNFLSLSAGFVMIVLPFVIYFAAHGALYEMLYGTILFNVSYATQGKIEYELATRLEVTFIHLMPMILLIFFSTLLIVRDRKNKLAWSSIFVGAMMSILLMNLRLYIHYYMVVVPVMPLLFAVLKSSLKIYSPILSAPHFFKRLFAKILVVIAAMYALMCCFQYSMFTTKYLSAQYISEEKKIYDEEVQGIRRLQSIIPEDERKSFACWGNFYSTPHWILVTDMKPNNQRFFMNNSVQALLSPAQKVEWFQNVRNSKILWILYGTNKKEPKSYVLDTHRPDFDVEKLLAEKYTLRGETMIYDQVMKLYRLND